MMSKRVKIVVSVVVAVLVLSIAGTTATVMAQEEPTPMEEASGKGLLARVAEILNEQGYNVTEEALVNAFKQAGREMAEETLDRILDRLQEGCVVFDDKVASIEDWLAQRPEALDAESIEEWLEQRPGIGVSGPGLHIRTFGFPQQIGERLHCSGEPQLGLRPLLGRVAEILGIPEETLIEAFEQAQQEMMQEMRGMGFSKALDIAAEQGRITPEEAIQIEDWWGQRPAAVDSMFPGASICRTTRGRQMMAASRGWHGARLPGPTD